MGNRTGHSSHTGGNTGQPVGSRLDQHVRRAFRQAGQNEKIGRAQLLKQRLTVGRISSPKHSIADPARGNYGIELVTIRGKIARPHYVKFPGLFNPELADGIEKIFDSLLRTNVAYKQDANPRVVACINSRGKFLPSYGA